MRDGSLATSASDSTCGKSFSLMLGAAGAEIKTLSASRARKGSVFYA